MIPSFSGMTAGLVGGRATNPLSLRERARVRVAVRSGSYSSTTRNCPIMPRSSWSRMWQWNIYGMSSAR